MSFVTIAMMLLAGLSAQTGLAESSAESRIQFKVEKFQLKNGLVVLLHEDHRVPIVNLQLWYKVGSVHEKTGQKGLAHFFEHLMFRGTKKYPEETLQRLVQASGGDNNAFTTYEHTGYHVTFPPDKLELFLDIEADRMVNLNLTQQVVDTEREVVKEELRRKYARVEGVLFDSLMRTVFKMHPYGLPVIGEMADLNKNTLAEIINFYKTYYAPNNAVMALVGDIDSKSAKKLIRKLFDPLPSQVLPPVAQFSEPDQRSERSVELRKDVQSPTLSVAFRGAPAGDPDAYALDLLANIAGNGNSSRLYRRLVYKSQIADSASAWSYTPKSAGVFSLRVGMKPGMDLEKALSYSLGEIYELRAREVTDVELEKAKNQILKGFVDSLKTAEGKAEAIVSSEVTLGSYDRIFGEIERYQSVTKEQLKAVAEKYLTPQKRTVIKVLPKTAKVDSEEKSI